MTIDELGPVLAYVQTACGMRDGITAEQTAVWFELLQDLPAKLVRAAATRVLLDHEYPTLPAVGLIRKAARDLCEPATPGPKAWEAFLGAVRKHGMGKRKLWSGGKFIVQDFEAEGLATLPPQVQRAARAFGWQTLCETSNEDLGIAQTQFLKVYATLGDHEERHAITPPAVQEIAAQLAGQFSMDAKPTPAIAEGTR